MTHGHNVSLRRLRPFFFFKVTWKTCVKGQVKKKVWKCIIFNLTLYRANDRFHRKTPTSWSVTCCPFYDTTSLRDPRVTCDRRETNQRGVVIGRIKGILEIVCADLTNVRLSKLDWVQEEMWWGPAYLKAVCQLTWRRDTPVTGEMTDDSSVKTSSPSRDKVPCYESPENKRLWRWEAERKWLLAPLDNPIPPFWYFLPSLISKRTRTTT